MEQSTPLRNPTIPPNTPVSFDDCVAKARDRKVVIIGDPIVDMYFDGSAHKLATEHPCPVFCMRETVVCAGAALLVACQLHDIGWQAIVFGSFGKDWSEKNAEHFSELGIRTEICVREHEVGTYKYRYTAGPSCLLRVDVDLSDDFAYPEEFLDKLKGELETADVVIVSDYGKGSITPRVLALLEKAEAMIYLDPYPQTDYGDLHVAVAKLTQREAAEALRRHNQQTWIAAGTVLTDGSGEVTVSTHDDYCRIPPQTGRSLCCSVGAGDCFLGYLVTCHQGGMSLRAAAEVAHRAAHAACLLPYNCIFTPDQYRAIMNFK